MFDKRKDTTPTDIDRRPKPEPPRSPAPPRPASVIGRTVSIDGNLTAQEDVLVEGRFNGEVVLNDNALVVGSTGDVRANVKAKIVTIHGKANGDIQATDQVEISASGSMRGDILSPRVILQDGAKFKGRIDMEPEGIEKATEVPTSGSKGASAKPADAAATTAKPAETRARA